MGSHIYLHQGNLHIEDLALLPFELLKVCVIDDQSKAPEEVEWIISATMQKQE